MYKNLLGSESILGNISRNLLTGKDSALAKFLRNWFGSDSLVDRILQKFFGKNSAFGQLIADRESVIGQMISALGIGTGDEGIIPTIGGNNSTGSNALADGSDDGISNDLLLGKNSALGKLMRNILGRDSLLAKLFKNLLGDNSIIGKISQALLTGQDSALAKLIRNWFGPDSFLGSLLQKIFGKDSAFGQLIADKESVIGQILDKFFGPETLLGQKFKNVIPVEEKPPTKIRKFKKTPPGSYGAQPFNYRKSDRQPGPVNNRIRRSAKPEMINEQVDGLTEVIFAALRNEECTQRLLCEVGQLSRNMSDAVHSTVSKSIVPFVPSSLKKSYIIFSKAEKCDQYSCGSSKRAKA